MAAAQAGVRALALSESPQPAAPRSLGVQLDRAVQRFEGGIAARHRLASPPSWQDLSWPELRRRVRGLAAALIELGVAHGDRVAVLSGSRLEWMLIDLACMSTGAVTVPIYPSNLPAEVHYVLDHADCTLVFCEDREQLGKVLEVRERLTGLRHAVLVDGKVKDQGFVLSFDKQLDRGLQLDAQDPTRYDARRDAVVPDDMASICYTSGTTGPPKGVVLTQGNLIYEAQALSQVMNVGPADETLLFLPLSHIFGRVGCLGMLVMGYTVSFAESIERAVDNMGEIRPTFAFSVPRVYEKVYEKVLGDVGRAGRLKKQIFAFAMAVGRAVSCSLQRGRGVPLHLRLSYRVAEMLVFGKLKRLFGGELRFFISGGAALSQEIAEFFHAAGMLVLEAYGLTENVAGANLNLLHKNKFGTVGPTLPGMEERIAADGEILMRGPNLFREYYKNPEATAEAIDAEGWFHTGDIGRFDDDGHLRITDRKKDLIVTSGGKNISPQNIENLIKTHPLISQVMVHGDKRKYLSAIVTLNPDELGHWLRRRDGLDANAEIDLATAGERDDVRAKVQRVIDAKNRELASYETIKKFAIVWPDFEVGEELTPSQKVKRPFTTKKYQAQLDALYSDASGQS